MAKETLDDKWNKADTRFHDDNNSTAAAIINRSNIRRQSFFHLILHDDHKVYFIVYLGIKISNNDCGLKNVEYKAEGGGAVCSSVDSFAPSILPPQVRIPSTPSMLFSI